MAKNSKANLGDKTETNPNTCMQKSARRHKKILVDKSLPVKF